MSLRGHVDVSRAEGLYAGQKWSCHASKAGTYHLDLPQGFLTVILEVGRLLAVDAHFTKKQLRVQPQRKWTASSHLWPDDDLATLWDLVLQHLGLGKLLLLVRGKPDVRKGTLLEEEILWKKHGRG